MLQLEVYKMKKILFLVLALLLSVVSVSGADFYKVYQPDFTDNVPTSVFISGAACESNDCSSVSGSVELYNGNAAVACWNTYMGNSNVAALVSCLDSARIVGNVHPITANGDYIVVKEDSAAALGHLTYFSADGDEYLVKYSRTINYNCEAGVEICFNSDVESLNFIKADNVIAEVGQVNVINTNNDLLPVQVTVPVTIEETICSAFRFTNPNAWRPSIPTGYSDYDAETRVSLDIRNDVTGVLYQNSNILIPIEADSCAGLAAFSWTPDITIENESVKFSIETEVTDGQVSSSLTDWTEVVEVVNPIDLDGVCWSRAYDFTLSNINSFELTTSVAQITEGESLFALFSSGAYRDNSITPMDFTAELLFDGISVYSNTFTSSAGLTDYSVDLTSSITGLSAGNHQVTLVTTPVSAGCDAVSPVTQTQNLELLQIQRFDVSFDVMDTDYMRLEDASITFELLSASDYFVTTPVYLGTGLTDTNGAFVFSNMVAGTYSYTITKDGYSTASNDVIIGSDTDISVTLSVDNSLPVVNLPADFTSYFANDISFDVSNYVYDFNELFSDLTVEYTVISGGYSVIYNSPNFIISSFGAPTTGVLRVTVTDSFGASSYDDVVINFIDNTAPVINSFYATPDNGDLGFTTTFIVDVTDVDSAATCEIDFDDGTPVVTDVCVNLNGTTHIYGAIGTYNTLLTVLDGVNAPVYGFEQVFVYEILNLPIIEYFTMSSSNGQFLMTDLTFDWNVYHNTPGTPMNCSLNVLGVDYDVVCASGSITFANFNVTGISDFTLTVVDNESNTLSQTVSEEFFTEAALLENMDARLIVDEVIVPGKFDFSIEIYDEVLVRRMVNFKPVITCRGTTNELSNPVDGVLNIGVVSSVKNDRYTYELSVDSNDFKLNVPKDVWCNFEIELFDDIGSRVNLSEVVMFSYPVEVAKLLSIRGKGTDVLNYMSTILSSEIKTGYNSIAFKVENREGFDKKLSISVMSTSLGLDYSIDEYIGVGDSRNIDIPLYIEKNVKPGMYPIRFSVYDGEDKQVRYSYIRVE